MVHTYKAMEEIKNEEGVANVYIYNGDVTVQHQVGIQTREQATNVYVIQQIQDDQIGTQ